MREATISDAEWEVMRVVWASSPVTSQTIIDILSSKMSWKPGTIKTLINRLLNKGYLTAQKEGRAFLYQATVSEKQMLIAAFKGLLNQTCAKRSGELLGEILQDTLISQHDLQNLDHIIQEKIQTAPKEISCDCLPGQCQCQIFNRLDI